MFEVLVGILIMGALAWFVYDSLTVIKREYLSIKKSLFANKELPIIKTIEMNKRLGFIIELYDLEKNEDGTINRDNYWFAKAIKIINRNLYIDMNTNELCMNDLTDDKFKADYSELTRLFSNFDFNIFVFKENSKHKNLMDASFKHNEELKLHANKMIEKCFYELMAIYTEQGAKLG